MRISRTRSLVTLGLAVAMASAATAAESRHVYILLIDGCDARRLTEETTPTLWALSHPGPLRATSYSAARAAMPSVTNTNHAAIMTAAYSAANGIVGNSFWDRDPAHAPVSTESAQYLEVETLFTVIEKERPALVTAGLFGKSKLVNLFSAVPDQQHAPDMLWGDAASEAEAIDVRAGFASDQRTMDEVVRTIEQRQPDFMFAALPDVDRTSHIFGPDSVPARKALSQADRQVGRLLTFLQQQESWPRTVLMITADHGFASVEPNRAEGRPYPLVLFGRELLRAGFTDLVPVANGAVESIALAGGSRDKLSDADGQRMAQARALALAQPEVAEAWYRVPNPADGGSEFTLAHAHPDWHLEHPRTGELILVAKPHHHFGDPFTPRVAGLLGNHGGPDESHIPILITGGDPSVRAQVVADDGAVPQAANPDLGATAAWLLGVRMPRTIKGKAVPKELTGRVLREAFEPSATP
ncbi:MAG: alkaline phosphatase family protein [Deltaproteobacteria bacterium]|nr:alkaline phosphatase family protein [Deltaproteobacteria bacterium]MBI3391176.1 alkaline phosphatase family protein [Deltaproteobacteria bacterium]